MTTARVILGLLRLNSEGLGVTIHKARVLGQSDTTEYDISFASLWHNAGHHCACWESPISMDTNCVMPLQVMAALTGEVEGAAQESLKQDVDLMVDAIRAQVAASTDAETDVAVEDALQVGSCYSTLTSSPDVLCPKPMTDTSQTVIVVSACMVLSICLYEMKAMAASDVCMS